MFVQKNIRFIFVVGLLLYCIQIVLAILFYKERTLFIDMAYHSFEITHFKTFAIQNNRYGALFSQLLPVLAVKFSLPLKYVLIVYSCSFIILNLSIFLILLTKFKNVLLAILLLCCHFLLTRETFYWIQSELQQGISFLLLFWGYFFYLLEKKNFTLYQKIFFFFFILCLQFFHPILLIVQLFLLIFIYQLIQLKNQQLLNYYSICLIIITGAKLLFFQQSSYDNEAFAKIHHLIQFFPNYFTLPIYKQLAQWIKNDYWLFILFIITASILLVIHKNYKILVVSLLSLISYVFLITVMYYNNTPQFYFENLILPIVILFCFPLLYSLQRKAQLHSAAKYFFLFFSVNLLFMAKSQKKFSDRLVWHQQFLNTHTPSKLIIHEQLIPTKDTLIMSWGIGYELILLQALNNKNIIKCAIVVPSTKDYEKYTTNPAIFIGNWYNYEYKKMNSNYYLLNDTSNYVIKNE